MRSHAAVAILAILLLALTTTTDALYYAFQDLEPLCFVQEVIESTRTITGTYRLSPGPHEEYASTEVLLTITEPSGQVSHEKTLHTSEKVSSFHFPVQQIGSYLICLAPKNTYQPPTNSRNAPLTGTFAFDQSREVGAKLRRRDEEVSAALLKRKQVNGMDVLSFTDYGGQKKNILQPREYLINLDKSLMDATSHMSTIDDYTQSIINAQVQSRSSSESSFTTVWVCALLTTLIAVAVVTWQFRTLKMTLERRKLV